MSCSFTVAVTESFGDENKFQHRTILPEAPLRNGGFDGLRSRKFLRARVENKSLDEFFRVLARHRFCDLELPMYALSCIFVCAVDST